MLNIAAIRSGVSSLFIKYTYYSCNNYGSIFQLRRRLDEPPSGGPLSPQELDVPLLVIKTTAQNMGLSLHRVPQSRMDYHHVLINIFFVGEEAYPILPDKPKKWSLIFKKAWSYRAHMQYI